MNGYLLSSPFFLACDESGFGPAPILPQNGDFFTPQRHRLLSTAILLGAHSYDKAGTSAFFDVGLHPFQITQVEPQFWRNRSSSSRIRASALSRLGLRRPRLSFGRHPRLGLGPRLGFGRRPRLGLGPRLGFGRRPRLGLGSASASAVARASASARALVSAASAVLMAV